MVDGPVFPEPYIPNVAYIFVWVQLVKLDSMGGDAGLKNFVHLVARHQDTRIVMIIDVGTLLSPQESSSRLSLSRVALAWQPRYVMEMFLRS
jgi:hypothetical protein